MNLGARTETTLVVVVTAVQHSINCLRLVADSNIRSVVAAVAARWVHTQPVNVVPTNLKWIDAGIRWPVPVWVGTSPGCHSEVVSFATLVVNFDKDTGCCEAEIFLRSGVGETSRDQHFDINCLII
eukprot:SAG31_NODE_377_length_16533_cov_99.867957_13_plen_126_part_00